MGERLASRSPFCFINFCIIEVEEDARIKIHQAGGTKELFEWYTDMDFVVQLEALAAMVSTIQS
jgi:hypothetical protein